MGAARAGVRNRRPASVQGGLQVPRPSKHGVAMQPFALFLDEWRRRHGLTLQQIEDRGGPRKSTTSALINRHMKSWPDPETIAQVSVGMGIPESVLWQKLQETLGAPDPALGAITPEHAILADPKLSNRWKDVLLEQLRLARETAGVAQPEADLSEPPRQGQRRRSTGT